MSTDLTASCDGTTKCHVNLESRHIALRVEPYSDAPDANPSTAHRVRLLGVDASVDHTSETQVRGWKRKADEVSQLYHESPFAERTQTSLSPDDLVLKLCGMNGDHMEDQKKTFRLMREWKNKATYCKLGQEAMDSLLRNEWVCLHPVIEVVVQKKIEQHPQKASRNICAGGTLAISAPHVSADMRHEQQFTWRAGGGLPMLAI